jgi:hypothetical protein
MVKRVGVDEPPALVLERGAGRGTGSQRRQADVCARYDI